MVLTGTAVSGGVGDGDPDWLSQSQRSKVFANWLLSREGQQAFYEADFAVPAHPAMRLDRKYVGRFVDFIVGRQWSVREPEDEVNILPEVRKAWQPLWIG